VVVDLAYRPGPPESSTLAADIGEGRDGAEESQSLDGVADRPGNAFHAWPDYRALLTACHPDGLSTQSCNNLRAAENSR
jgi:hypothetical protein